MNPDLMHWIAVARRNPVSLLCGLIVIICGAVSMIVYRVDIKPLELEIKQIGVDIDLMDSTLISGPSVRQELTAAREATRRIEDNLVIEDNLAENLWYFYKMEQKTKARLVELHQLNSAVTDVRSLYRRVPYSIRVAGTYEQAASFLYEIETGPRLANITAVSVERSEAGSLAVVMDIDLEMLGKK